MVLAAELMVRHFGPDQAFGVATVIAFWLGEWVYEVGRGGGGRKAGRGVRECGRGGVPTAPQRSHEDNCDTSFERVILLASAPSGTTAGSVLPYLIQIFKTLDLKNQ